MIEAALERAVSVNKQYRVQLDALVAALLERETLDAPEVLRILGPSSPADTEVGITPRQPLTPNVAVPTD
jgi:ATP-dependent Zn protease